MTKKLINFSLALFLLIAYSSNAQTLKRTVLYTLAQNEKMVYEIGQNRFIVEPSENGYKFATIIENKKDNQNSLLIFNGKKFPIILWQEPYFNVQKANGYGFSFIKNNQTYINLSDTIYGPYEKCDIFYQDGEVGYSYKLLGKWYEYFNGNISGPYIGSSPNSQRNEYSLKINDKYAYVYKESNDKQDYYVNINGFSFGPYLNNQLAEPENSTPKVELFANGKYSIHYLKDDPYGLGEGGLYVDFNGKMYGPYEHNPFIPYSYTEDGSFIYWYSKEWMEEYINLNDSIFGPFQDIRDVVITSKKNYGYYFARDDYKTPEIDMYYVNINNKEFGPYSFAPKYGLKLLENGMFAFDFVQKSNMISQGKEIYNNYININGPIFGPYDDLFDYEIFEKGEYFFKYVKDNTVFVNINGNIKKQLDVDFDSLYVSCDFLNKKNEICANNEKKINNFNLYGVWGGYQPEFSVISNDSKHQLIYNEEPEEKGVAFKYNYVVVDGKKYGKALPVTASWYEERKSFVWSSIEGKDFVAYELTYDDEFKEYKTLKIKNDSIIHLGDLCFNNKDYNNAITFYMSAYSILKNKNILCKITNAKRAIKNAKKQTSIINGDKYFANKQFKEALVEYKLANEFEQSNDVTDKIKTTQEAIEKIDKYDSIITNGDTYFNQKKYKLAILEYNKASVVDNNSDINIKLRSCDAEISKIDSLQKLRIHLFIYIKTENDSIKNQRDVLKLQLLDKKKIYGQNYDSCMTFLSLNFTNRLSSITKLFDPNNREIIDTWNETDQKSLEELFNYKEEFEKYKMFHKTIKFAFETENKEKLKLLKSSDNPSEIISKYL